MTPEEKFPFEDIIGYPVTTLSRTAILNRVADWLDESGPARVFACANPHSLHVAESDPEFRNALLEADLLTPDGIGIVIGSKLLGGHIHDRITGHDVFEDTCELLHTHGGSVFFLGSTTEVLQKIVDRLQKDYPNLRVAGTYSPPFREEFTPQDDIEMIAAVNTSCADVLWVGMTAPKQEKWIARNVCQLDVRFIGAIGAVFDFYAGTVPRSPILFRRLGLEWLPRLLQQPGRLWRRNFVSNPAFVKRVLAARMNRRR